MTNFNFTQALANHTPQQINQGLNHLAADLILLDTIEKLQTCANNNRATLITPAEAQALLDHVRGLDALRRGIADSIFHILAEAARVSAEPVQ